MHAALLRACATGDSAALARLYEATSAQLFGLALRIVRRRELAEEVVQDAFLSAWRHAGRYDERRGTAMAWLATIVRNRALDQLRRLGRERPLEPAMAERWQDPAPADSGVEGGPAGAPLGLWDSLALWRGLAAGAVGLAAGLLLYLGLVTVEVPPVTPSHLAVLANKAAEPALLATIDDRDGRVT